MSLSSLNNCMVHAVKAIIYREDRHILFQQRDYTPGIIFPGYWTFFGGQVEAGENLKEALRRELQEELGCIPGCIEEELFQWAWTGENPSQNHYFPVRYGVNDDVLELNEGQAMRWFSFEDLQNIELTPGVYENLFQLSRFLGGLVPDAAIGMGRTPL